MKSVQLFHILFLVGLTTIVLFAQNNISKTTINEKPVEKKAVMVDNASKLKVTAATGDSVVFRDGDGNTLLKITDEGTVGSITIPSSGSAPSSTTNKLYNVGSTLYFNGSSLGSGGVSAINDLSDAKSDGSSVFLGNSAGANDGGSNYNTALGISALQFNVSGKYNTANGRGALTLNTTGNYNTANGYYALYHNNGNYNTANGYDALYTNTTGEYNTANGSYALYYNKTGSDGVAVGYQSQFYANNTTTAFNNQNTSVGYQSLMGSTTPANNTGNNNSAFGYQTLYNNTSGYQNTANGFQALYSNMGGYNNTAIGWHALSSNTTGYGNTANGLNALYSETTGIFNTASGAWALNSNTIGSSNTANGNSALYSNTTGGVNTAIGIGALYHNETGNYNTAVGNDAGPNNNNLNNTTALGNQATVSSSNQVRIGNSLVTSIGGSADWTNISDIRYKKNIREDVVGLDFIMGLKPITYNLDVNALAEKLGEDFRIDKNGNRVKVEPDAEVAASREKKASMRQSGFSAQAVEALAKKLGFAFGGVDIPENKNGLYGLRYSEFVVPLVKAVQEQQKIIVDEKKTIGAQQQEINELKQEMLKIEKAISTKVLADARN